jgi:hypothetical protein
MKMSLMVSYAVGYYLISYNAAICGDLHPTAEVPSMPCVKDIILCTIIAVRRQGSDAVKNAFGFRLPVLLAI